MWIQSMDLHHKKEKNPTRTNRTRQNLVLTNHGKLVR